MILIKLIGFVGWLYFFKFCQKDGEILERYADFIQTLPLFIAKPLGYCIYCTAFWHFAIFCFFDMPLFIWGFGIVFLIIKFYENAK